MWLPSNLKVPFSPARLACRVAITYRLSEVKEDTAELTAGTSKVKLSVPSGERVSLARAREIHLATTLSLFYSLLSSTSTCAILSSRLGNLTMTSFAHMSRSEKRDQIISEGATNETQITMDPLDVDMLLAALESTPKRKLVENYSDSDSLHIIADNWGIDMSKFPALHHERDFCPSSWDTRSLATLAVLSEFTPGQGDRMGSFLCSAVELRVGNGRVQKDLWVKEVEIKRVIRDELKPLREPACVL